MNLNEMMKRNYSKELSSCSDEEIYYALLKEVKELASALGLPDRQENAAEIKTCEE